MPTQAELLKQARDRGIGDDVLADDAKVADIKKVLDSIGPTPEEAAQEGVGDVNAGGAEQFPVQRVINEAEAFFGVASHALAGALHGYDKQTITLDEARAALDGWSKATVHVGEDQEA